MVQEVIKARCICGGVKLGGGGRCSVARFALGGGVILAVSVY